MEPGCKKACTKSKPNFVSLRLPILKDYYRILEVASTATAADIKKSYRRLAQLYHPDRNSSEHAEALFKEINAAYEVLGDPVKRWEYDNRLTATPTSPVHPDPAIRRRPAGYRPQPKGPSETYLAMQAVLPYVRYVFYVGSFLCLALAVDFLLPSNHLIERVQSNAYESVHIRGNVTKTALVTESGKRIELAVDDIHLFPEGSNVDVQISKLFSILIRVHNTDSNQRTGNLATVYRNYSFAPIVLLIVSVLGLMYPRRVEFVFNLAVVGVFVILLTIFFLFQSIP